MQSPTGTIPSGEAVGGGVGPTAPDPDLLRWPPVRALIGWRGFPRLFQAMLLAVFVALIVLSWGVFAPSRVDAKLFAKCHFVTLLIWGIWWPAMVWVAILFGRLWCAVCPLELVGAHAESLGRALGLPQLPLRRWAASGVVILAFYALLQMSVAGAHINRVPAYTSFFLLGLLGLATLTGLVFRDRAFCRGFCPVGLLLGTYGRGGMVAVRPGIPPGPDARTCPSLLNPSRLASNQDCLVCCRCIQRSAPGAMRLLLRRPFAETDARTPLATWPVTLFVMLVSGFVLWELCTEWPAAEHVFLSSPDWAAARLGWPAARGWFEGVWALGVVPLTVWSVLAGTAQLFGHREGLGDFWRRMALPMAVVVSAGHMSKGLAKLVSWAPFLAGAMKDPTGVATAQAVADQTMTAPAPWLPKTIVAVIGAALVVTAFVYSVREYRLAQTQRRFGLGAAFPLAVVATAFLGIVVGWAQ